MYQKEMKSKRKTNIEPRVNLKKRSERYNEDAEGVICTYKKQSKRTSNGEEELSRKGETEIQEDMMKINKVAVLKCILAKLKSVL